MSQRQRKSQRPSSSHQPRPGTSSQMEVDDDDNLPASQISPNKNLTNQEHAHHVSNVVKYILSADHSKIPINKATISRAVECHNRNFRSIMDAAIKVLKDVFGYDVLDQDGKLLVYNHIKNEHLEYTEDESKNYILLFIILAHIFMSGGRCTQGSLIHFLTRLGIVTDGNMKSHVFGDILELVTVTFAKEKYLEVEKSENTDMEEPELRWGPRAECELSSRTVMEFVSKVYRNKKIESWPQQYQKMLEDERRHSKAPAMQNGHA